MNLTTILNKLEKECLSVKLGEEQRNVLLGVFNILMKPAFNECVILGKGGVGKTLISRIIIEFIEQYLRRDYYLVTPTHKSKRILSEQTQRPATTIHQLLKLQPNLEILDFSFKNLQFQSTQEDVIPEDGVLLIDECSMINDDLYDTIVKKCKAKNCKIIFEGDVKQLAAVKQKRIGKVFNCENSFELTKIYRQQETNPLIPILEELRRDIILNFEENENLKIYKTWQEFLKNNIDLFKEAIKTGNPDKVKILAYTNKRIAAYNMVIRNFLFDNPEEFEKNDLLMGYDNTTYRDSIRVSIENSTDYRVLDKKKCKKFIAGLSLNGWELTICNTNSMEVNDVFVLSKNNPEEDLKRLAMLLDYLRVSAVVEKDKYIKSKN